MKLLSVLLSIAGVSSLVWVCPVIAETSLDAKTERRKNAEKALVEKSPSLPIPQFPSQSSSIDLLAQDNLTRVTGVEVNQTESGLELVLETVAGSERLVPLILPEGNDLVIEILDATLAFSIRNGVTEPNPAPGIRRVTVNNAEENSIRVRITGSNQAPNAEVVPGKDDLVLSVTPDGTTAEIEPDEEIEVIATGEAEDDADYYVPDATTATKTDIPIQDIPGSIQVIPEQVIEDRQVVRFSELADNVSGVTPQSGYGGLSSQSYYLRGFSLDSESFRNGFRDFGFISPRDVANVERVEFLKGPASVLYGGSGNFSGLVNTVTKKPVTEPLYNLDFTIGNNNFYRPTLDFGGAFTEDKSLSYRLNVAYENADSFRDFNESESIFVAPALTWQIGDRTTLTAEFEYQNYNYVFDRGLLPAEIFFALPINRFLGEPDFNDAEYDSFSGTYNFEHEFGDNWKFRQGFNALSISGDTQIVAYGGSTPFVEEDGRTLPRRATRTDESSENYTLQNEISNKFNTGSISHNVLLGVELSTFNFAYDFFRASIDSIDILDPVYGAEPGVFEPSFAEEYGTDNIGVYLQDFVEFSSKIKFLAGVRLDWSNSTYKDTQEDSFDFEESNFAASPRLGIVYQPIDSTSLYASWTNSFRPEFFGRVRSGDLPEPSTGEQFEIGVKQEFFDGKASATLAFYDLTRSNVLTTDPEDPDFSIQAREQTSRGIELDVAGEILPGWNVIATYAYTDAFVSEDEDLPEGDRLQGVPENSASLWTTYELQQGSLQGLGFGFGLYFVGDREIQLPNTIQLDSYVRADAAIFYRRNNYELALNFKNITDTKYYSTQGFYVTPEAPFTVLGNVSVTF